VPSYGTSRAVEAVNVGGGAGEMTRRGREAAPQARDGDTCEFETC